MKCNKIFSEDKLRLVRAFRNHDDYQHLADQLGIKRDTARKIVARALKQDDPECVEKQRGGARHVKVDAEMREMISEIIAENPAATLVAINSELRQRLPSKPCISNNYVAQICRGMFYTVKKLESPAARNSERVKQQRKEYARWFIEFELTKPRVVYINESGFNVWIQRTRGRARRGVL